MRAIPRKRNYVLLSRETLDFFFIGRNNFHFSYPPHLPAMLMRFPDLQISAHNLEPLHCP